MPVLLAFALHGDTLYAAGPDGLFRVDNDSLEAAPQPMESLYCVGSTGDLLLAGGSPFGVAYLTAAGEWQGGWMDHAQSPVVAIAPAPGAEHSGLLLAASAGDGLLRSTNHGRSWVLSNFGLREFTILCVTWAPQSPPGRWPAREVAFCGGERGLYRSPAGGLGWSHVADFGSAIQSIAVSRRFHEDGVVLAGCEESGLWRSIDGGRTFGAVADMPERIDSLLALEMGWLAAAPAGVWFSQDSISWTQIDGAAPALCLVETPHGIYSGGEQGLGRLADASIPYGQAMH